MKKIIALLIIMLLISAPVSAEDIYGTPEEGFMTEPYSFQNVAPTNSFMNADFSEGLKYWTSRNAIEPSKQAKVIKVGEDNAIQLTPPDVYCGITTPLFTDENLRPGQNLLVFCEFKDSLDFQIYITQWIDGVGKRITSYSTKVLYEAANDSEWNVLCAPLGVPTLETKNKGDKIYISIAIETLLNKKANPKINKVWLGLQNAQGNYHDFDGTPYTFADNNIVDENEEDADVAAKYLEQPAEENSEKSTPDEISWILVVIIAVLAVVIIGGFFGWIFLRKRKK